MQPGHYEADYRIGADFFAEFPQSEVQEGKVDVHVDFIIAPDELNFYFTVSGSVKADCDRCLESFDLPINGDFKLNVKFGEENSDWADEDEDIILSEQETSIDLKHYVYEFVSLSIPQRRVHPLDENGMSLCNPEMTAAIMHAQDFGGEDDSDPRWDALRDLYN